MNNYMLAIAKTLRPHRFSRICRAFVRRVLLVAFTLSSILGPVGSIAPAAVLPTTSSAPSTDAATGGYLGWPASPAIDLRSAADAHVTPIGSYKTSIPIDVPLAPGAPNLSLNYDSAMGLGIAGIGWDLSVGWPAVISRDPRFGTPIWNYASPWMWGGMALVPEDRATCENDGICKYRTAPDSLARIEMNQSKDPNAARALVRLPSGVLLTYEAVHYDGTEYPSAPSAPADPQKARIYTDVFTYILNWTLSKGSRSRRVT
jgi:hypothetical protein